MHLFLLGGFLGPWCFASALALEGLGQKKAPSAIDKRPRRGHGPPPLLRLPRRPQHSQCREALTEECPRPRGPQGRSGPGPTGRRELREWRRGCENCGTAAGPCRRRTDFDVVPGVAAGKRPGGAGGWRRQARLVVLAVLGLGVAGLGFGVPGLAVLGLAFGVAGLAWFRGRFQLQASETSVARLARPACARSRSARSAPLAPCDSE